MSYKTHGLKYISVNPLKTRSEYAIWSGMKGRCLNANDKAYQNYGGRGITVCETWMRFENFYNDMGNRPSLNHSLDRIDNNKGYCKENCRWAVRLEQENNKRTNTFYELNGERLTLANWARKINIESSTIKKRIDAGWGIERALTQVHRYKKYIQNV